MDRKKKPFNVTASSVSFVYKQIYKHFIETRCDRVTFN